ncbi:MAG: DUF123 domain-containing protein [Promethearchaeota archaeon]
MKGIYALVIEMKRNLATSVGALGILSFSKGIWVYVGSAMGAGSTSIENRLQRHFRTQKAIHWHVDYLLNAGANPKAAVVAESDTQVECKLAMLLTNHQSFRQGPTGFGASDCKASCKTHLFSYSGSNSPVSLLEDILGMLDLQPRVLREEDTGLKATST